MSLQVQEAGVKLFKLDGAEVFYNETQLFNRDFSMLAAHTFLEHQCPMQAVYQQNLTILDAMSASGLRAMRYSQEMRSSYAQTAKHSSESVVLHTQVIANDLSENAIKHIRNNIEMQDIKPQNITVSHANCVAYMNEHEDETTIVDLDPYGHPSIFFGPAISTIQDHGLLAATATDGLVTCGRQPQECLMRYQALPAHTVFAHEFSVRIVLASLALSCIRARVGMDVLYSFYHCHYLRIFCQINKKRRKQSAELWNSLATYCYCKGCGWFRQLQLLGSDRVASAPPEKCPICGGGMFRAGPIWVGNLAAREFCQWLLDELDESQRGGNGLVIKSRKLIRAHINYMLHEFDRPPLFYELQALSSAFHTHCLPTNLFLNYCEMKGKPCSGTSFSALGIKTDIAHQDIIDLFYFWWNMMQVAQKTTHEWTGKWCHKIQFTRADVMALTQGFCKDKEQQVQITQEMDVRGFVSDSAGLRDVLRRVSEWEHLREFRLFEANPAKNWGPKRMK